MNAKWFGSAVLLLVSFSAASADTYTLEQLIDEAYKNSKQLRSVQEEIKKAEAQINEAYGSALPSVSASANVSHAFATYSPYSMPSGGPALPPAGLAVRSSPEWTGADTILAQYIDGISMGIAGLGDLFEPKPNTAALSLTLSQPIFAQGKVSVGLKIARAYQSTLLCKHNDEKMKLKAAITKLFYASLLAQKGVEIKQESVKLATETHRLSIIRQAIGKGSELDTLSSLLFLENAKIDLQKSESDKRMAHQTIIMKTGIATNAAGFEVAGEFADAVFEMSIDDVLETVRRDNNTLKQLDGTEQIQDQLVRLAKTDFLPLVFAGASLSKIGQFDGLGELGESDTWGDDRKVFAGLTWNIFTGFKRIQKVRLAQTDREIFLLTKKQAIEGLELAARGSFEQVLLSRDRLVTMRGVLALAEKGNSIAGKAYEVGSRTFLDVQNANLELNKARIGYNAALFEFHSALVDLSLLMGKL